ncbi:uncharacterized protein [Miscanthus floridulus]|uniref:uncharacterized protein isoform X2 n=1 Tax=Miscanthus floridulus TaxID=154761 RepID=UPI00345A535A
MATSDPAATSAPQSPGVGGVPLSSCIGDLLRFVLSSHATAHPGDDTAAFPLSPSYCARLLNDGELFLFGKLEACIQQCLEEGRLPGPHAVVGITAAEEGPEERGWELLLLEKGAELKRMYDAVDFELHVQEPYFTQLRAGAKKVEGRLATGNYNRITQGSLLLFNKSLLLNVEEYSKKGVPSAESSHVVRGLLTKADIHSIFFCPLLMLFSGS